MQIIRFGDGEAPARHDEAAPAPKGGFVWLDIVREETPDWPGVVKKVLGAAIHNAHVIDAENPVHPSFFDATDGYEMIVFRGLATTEIPNRFDTRPSTLFLTERGLATVRPASSVSAATVAERLFEDGARVPKKPTGLMLMVLSAMVDRFLSMREPLAEQIESWQDALLDPNDPFEDWMALMRERNALRRLERLCQEQDDAVSQWREETRVQLDGGLRVRCNDLQEHVRRVHTQATHLQTQLESLVQIHFAAVAHRTNEVMRVLTVLTAVFLPLSLLAGLFGMNFEYMPELKWRYGYFVVLGLMVLLAGTMLVYFRRKKWI